jgi:hypothetical protein
MKTSFCALLSLCVAAPLAAQPVMLAGESIRVSVPATDALRVTVEIRDGSRWVPALTAKADLLVQQRLGSVPCNSAQAAIAAGTLTIRGNCRGAFERQFRTTPEGDVIDVTVRLIPEPGQRPMSVEDRWNFTPATRSAETTLSGPLDFVWSSNLKTEPADIITHWGFKAPAVMLQQDRVFAALIPRVDLLTADSLRQTPPALDLEVIPGKPAWLSYGSVASTEIGHSYFRRAFDALPGLPGQPIEYSYRIVASAQPRKLGYRRVSRLLWEEFGSPELKRSIDLQKNARRPELFLFDDWRTEAWSRYADEKYWETDCGGHRCAGLTSNRNPWGNWTDAPRNDAWFNSWFQNLRTSFGWRLYARRTGNVEMERKAERILDLALTSPRHEGLFSTVYVEDTNRWFRDDGWAGFVDDYHTFCMSWTGYWMMRWAEEFVPGRKEEVLTFLRPYADFLVARQLPSGAIPSWFDTALKARPEFGVFNAETAGSALFLAEFSEFAAAPKYRDAAIRAQQFITREVIPRQRWYDFETFISCSRKPFDFYDRYTSQYPQNNLSQIQAALAYFKLFQLTNDKQYLETGQQVVDYLLLTQQVWNHPLFAPKLLGGTTTQNTDAEWSDARQAYVAPLLLDYYEATGRLDYLERSVAAARSGLSVAPWENWAHTGHIDEPGALTGFHWGTGSDMTSIEMMAPVLGDAFVNIARNHAVGFDACTVDHLRIDGADISFDLKAAGTRRRLKIRFAGAQSGMSYRIAVNGHAAVERKGADLAGGLDISVD